MKAARWIMKRGPRHVIIKKGEHGAFMFTERSVFFAPAYPLEDASIPPGAGVRSRGFMGHPARTAASMTTTCGGRVYGSAMGSRRRAAHPAPAEIDTSDIRQR